jgi:2-hydroxychromene-2-carboxylate isomerase
MKPLKPLQPLQPLQHLIFWFDVISPYAYLAFERMPEALEGLSYTVDYRPVLFAGLLEHWGQKGPAEIAPKRDWTYRQVAWLASEHGIPLDMPTQHPFNPLPILRLIVAAGANRRTVEAGFRHVWGGGADAGDAARLPQLTSMLSAQPTPLLDPNSPAVKDALRANTQAAIDQHIFGVPTISLGDQHFFGLDALPMLAAAMRGDAWFAGGGPWHQASQVATGVQRRSVATDPATRKP